MKKKKKKSNPTIEKLKNSFKIGATVPFGGAKPKEAIKLAYNLTTKPSKQITKEEKQRLRKEYNKQFFFGIPLIIISFLLLIWTFLINRWLWFAISWIPLILSLLLLSSKPK